MDYQIYYMFLLGGFIAVAYVMYVDPNVAKYIVLRCKIIQIGFYRAIFWLKFYPRLRYDTMVLKWRSSRIRNKRLKTPSIEDKEE